MKPRKRGARNNVRVLAIDPGMTTGFAALGGGRKPSAGSRKMPGGAGEMGKIMRYADRTIRELILAERPHVIALATIFIGSRGGRPIQPDAISPLMGVHFKAQEIADELGLRCVEISESECRRAFLTAVPKKSAEIKKAVMRACRLRGWPFPDEHAADSYCVASRALEILEPETAHETTPLFAVAPKGRRKKLV